MTLFLGYDGNRPKVSKVLFVFLFYVEIYYSFLKRYAPTCLTFFLLTFNTDGEISRHIQSVSSFNRRWNGQHLQFSETIMYPVIIRYSRSHFGYKSILYSPIKSTKGFILPTITKNSPARDR
jgi:hypothetical protein